MIIAEIASARPNILFIFADDQSYETVHSLGMDEIETPALDSMVHNGVVFTHAYNMGAWEGAYWGNHNSRDNFTDYALGFLAAMEAAATPGLPADLPPPHTTPWRRRTAPATVSWRMTTF